MELMGYVCRVLGCVKAIEYRPDGSAAIADCPVINKDPAGFEDREQAVADFREKSEQRIARYFEDIRRVCTRDRSFYIHPEAVRLCDLVTIRSLMTSIRLEVEYQKHFMKMLETGESGTAADEAVKA